MLTTLAQIIRVGTPVKPFSVKKMVKIMINVFSRGTDLPVNALCGKAGCITVAAACLRACFSQMILCIQEEYI